MMSDQLRKAAQMAYDALSRDPADPIFVGETRDELRAALAQPGRTPLTRRNEMTRDEMKAKMEQYLTTIGGYVKEGWYCSDRMREADALENFLHFLYREEMAKESRYATFLELKAEFETSQGEKA